MLFSIKQLDIICTSPKTDTRSGYFAANAIDLHTFEQDLVSPSNLAHAEHKLGQHSN